MEFVDMHFGTGPGEAIVDVDPYRMDDHLSEVMICSRDSKSVFFLVSIWPIINLSFFCYERSFVVKVYFFSWTHSKFIAGILFGGKALIGNDPGTFILPTSIDADVFECVKKNCCPEESNLLLKCYTNHNDKIFHLLKPTEAVRWATRFALKIVLVCTTWV